MAARNPLKWPEIEQLGREFHECLAPALEQMTSADGAMEEEARHGLAQLDAWLNAPCAATVKIDGTNVGVDNTGLLVGRNTVVEPGANYQKVDVWTLLQGYPEKVELFRVELQRLAGEEVIAQAMLYGELCVNGKYDYAEVGIFKGWLCFGAMLVPGAQDAHLATRRLSERLRAEGFNVRAEDEGVLVAPSPQLEDLLVRLGVPSVFGAYRPTSITEEQWAAHNGQGRLPRFGSMKQLLLSEWAQRVFLPANGVPPCEGLVISSEADGKLFKWKHGGEELGNVPQQLDTIVRQLQQLGDNQLLPEGLLEVCERLLLVATTKPSKNKPKTKKAIGEDAEGLAVFDSALTKFDVLEVVFEQGKEAMAAQQSELIEQVTKDLVKDYAAVEDEALKRATKVVRSQVGARFGAWGRNQHGSA